MNATLKGIAVYDLQMVSNFLLVWFSKENQTSRPLSLPLPLPVQGYFAAIEVRIPIVIENSIFPARRLFRRGLY